MFYLITLLLLVILSVGPSFWVKRVITRHSKNRKDIPGTGAELAIHLLRRLDFHDVKVELTTDNGDHYDPQANAVRLSPLVYEGKSLSAVAIAAHEVGHAIQFNNKEPVSQLREKYLHKAMVIKRIGFMLMTVLPVAGFIFTGPAFTVIALGIGLATLFLSVALRIAVLPEEWDASFNKALPILDQGDYVDKADLPAVRQILRAAAFTYVAGALAEIVSVWRWFRYLR